MSSMRQLQIQTDKTLALIETTIPECGPEEVLIKVKAIGVNRADLLQVKGLYPAPAGFDSAVPGLEYAGVIAAVGKRVQTRNVGERVMGLIPSAAYSEYLCVHELETLHIPEALTDEQAASIPEAFLTSYRALFIEGGLQAGQYCLIRPATAGVGLAAVQLANAMGAFPIGSSRQLTNLKAAQAMGLQYQAVENQQLGQQLLEKTHGQGVAVILDMVGPQWDNLLNGLRLQGCLVLVGVMAGIKTELNLFSLLMKRQQIKAMTMRSQPLDQRIAMARIFNDRLAPLFAVQKLQPLPTQRFSFNDAVAAHQHMQESDFSGKRIIFLEQ